MLPVISAGRSTSDACLTPRRLHSPQNAAAIHDAIIHISPATDKPRAGAAKQQRIHSRTGLTSDVVIRKENSRIILVDRIDMVVRHGRTDEAAQSLRQQAQ